MKASFQPTCIGAGAVDCLEARELARDTRRLVF